MNWTGKLTVVALFGALALPAIAQSNQEINARKENQQDRIAQGEQSGSLTAREAARVEHKEAALNKEERNMKLDGNFTPAERAKINRQQNQLSRDIYRQKHDAQAQPGPRASSTSGRTTSRTASRRASAADNSPPAKPPGWRAGKRTSTTRKRA